VVLLHTIIAYLSSLKYWGIEYLKPIFESTGAGRADGELVTYTYKFDETMIKVVRETQGPASAPVEQF
jgi:hypothetical protein